MTCHVKLENESIKYKLVLDLYEMMTS